MVFRQPFHSRIFLLVASMNFSKKTGHKAKLSEAMGGKE